MRSRKPGKSKERSRSKSSFPLKLAIPLIVLSLVSFVVLCVTVLNMWRPAAERRLDLPVGGNGGGSVFQNSSRFIRATNFFGDPYDLSETEKGLHVVYTIGCEEFKQWEIFTLDWSWNNTNHKGSLTRIVTGCPYGDKKARAMASRSSITGHPNFHIFFAPSYVKCKMKGFEGQGEYAPRDMPFAIMYWVNQAVFDEKYVAILDPDHIVLRNLERFLPRKGPLVDEDSDECNEDCTVRRGKFGPIASVYDGINMGWFENREKICTDNVRDCAKLSLAQGRKYFGNGSPYIMHRDDLKEMAPLWSFYTDDKQMMHGALREQYAHSAACLHTNLWTRLRPNLGVSSSYDVAWMKGSSNDWGIYVIHFNQEYTARNWTFRKWSLCRLPKPLTTCETPILAVPPDEVFQNIDQEGGWKRASLFALSKLLPSVNKALTAFKQRHCDQATANYQQTVKLDL